MESKLFVRRVTPFLEASQQDTSQKKSVTEKTMTQKLLTQEAQNLQPKYERKIVWRNVILLTYLHIGAIYGLYFLITAAKFYTTLWVILIMYLAGLGVTAGAHRLWCHRSYKAKWPMRVILMVLQTAAFQNPMYEWVRDHRVHHRYTDTDADPHNSKRGFFFSHMGWLMVRKHPDVISKGPTIDMSDVEVDPIVRWQRKLYIVLMPLLCFVIPTWVPIYFWNERPMYAWYAAIFKYVLSLHGTWLVNSAAHIWGMKPYDVTISATNSYGVSYLAFGEGWHNYHHVFPWDYKTSELNNYGSNITCAFIDFFAWLGWAYDLKTAKHDIIMKRATRTGDGSTYEQTGDNDEHYHTQGENIWGWDDVNMSLEDKQAANILNKID
ncbi:PREDICTED: acyl-CoA Delta(11) desaturase-like [Vollenhovia emeryi]|uniref:acyl-CoA Delta(11) desaturase-like n=1 Tax=Vollenhovia emeryi TaxID=411798 RepID=UPI0005F4561F|nr:PREDICTED: acyl-CoA Delta(11) desaturase-like [Vollenhovia emeryi]